MSTKLLRMADLGSYVFFNLPLCVLISLVPMGCGIDTLVGSLSIAEQSLQPIARFLSCQHVQLHCYILQRD